MTVKTSKLTGAALDWAVAKSEGRTVETRLSGLGGAQRFAVFLNQRWVRGAERWDQYAPSTNWAQGGPIIEREKMWVSWVESNYKHIDGCWSAHVRSRICYGPTPLIAAMRSFVASKLGDEVEVPEELLA